MAGTQLRTGRFRDEAELRALLLELWPDVPSSNAILARTRAAQRSVFAEGARILQVAFGFAEGTVTSDDPPPNAPCGSFDREHISVCVECGDELAGRVRITLRGSQECRPNGVATHFAGTLQRALSSALTAIEDARTSRAIPDDDGCSLEMIALSIEEWTTIAFLRLFIEEPRTEAADARADTFVPARALEQWIRRIPGATFEGNSLQTGLVLEASTSNVASRAAVCDTAFLDTPIPLTEALASKQDLVLADGRRTFLLVRKDMRVHGIVGVSSPVDLDYLRGDQSGDVDASMVDRLWIQVVDHRRLVIHGTMRDGSLIHVADIEQGELRLRDPRAELDIAVAAIEAIVSEGARAAVRPLVISLLTRALFGRGGGLVIGERPDDVEVRREIRPGFGVAVADRPWLSLLNCDGVALLDEALECSGVGCFIESLAGSRTGGLGTRHAALAKSTNGKRNVGVAISDDGTLTVYRGGRAVVRLG